MARRVITQEIYEALVNAYREAPGNHHNAGKLAGVFWKTAKKGWEQGFTNLEFAPAIRQFLEDEQAEARKIVAIDCVKKGHKDAPAAAALAREDALSSRVEVAAVARSARDNALALMQSTRTLLTACDELADKIKAELMSEDIDSVTAIRVITGVGKLVRDANEAGKLAVQLENLAIGEPTAILRVEHASVEEVEAEVEAAQMALARAKALGLDTPDPDDGSLVQ